MLNLRMVFLILALVAFILGAANVPARGANLTALGAAFATLALLLPGGP